MNITVKGNGNTPVELNAENLNIETAGDVLSSNVIKQIFGVGDDMVASVNGDIVNNDFDLADGDVITLTTKGHGKGASFDDDGMEPIDAVVTISSGSNSLEFSLEDIGSTAAEILSSNLIQTAFGVGDDYVVSINGGQPVMDDTPVEPGDVVSLSTRGHGKGC